MKKKLYVVTERFTTSQDSGGDVNRRDFHLALQQRFDCTYLYANKTWPNTQDLQPHGHSAVLVYVRFRLLKELQRIDWSEFKGPRLMYDEDTCQDRCYHRLGRGGALGRWTKAIQRLQFTDVITTDYHFMKDFSLPRVRCHWVPKYFNPSYLFPMEVERSGIGYYGVSYDARRAMLKALERKGVDIEVFRCSYEELNAHLNRLQACVVCNLAAGFEEDWRGIVRGSLQRIPKLRSWIHRIAPGFGVRYEPTLGTMFKNFEIPATGCVPFVDWMEELSLLGYEDGKTAVVYENFDELVEKIRFYRERPELLDRIGRQAQAVTLSRHGLQNRIDQIAEIIEKVSS